MLEIIAFVMGHVIGDDEGSQRGNLMELTVAGGIIGVVAGLFATGLGALGLVGLNPVEFLFVTGTGPRAILSGGLIAGVFAWVGTYVGYAVRVMVEDIQEEI